MKALLIFLGVFTFVTQAHCALNDEVNDFLPKSVPLKIENGSTKSISIEPIVEVSDILLEDSNILRGTTEKIQINSGETLELDPTAFATKWGLENVKIAGFTVAIDGLQKRYVAGDFKSSIRFNDINLREFFKK